MTNEQSQYDTFWQLVNDINICMAVSYRDGKFISQPLRGYGDREQNKIYFITRVAANIRQHYPTEMSLSYISNATPACMSISGRAYLSENKQKLESVWDNHAKVWFPEGPDNHEIALLEFTPVEATYWNVEDNMASIFWEFAKAQVTKNPPDVGEKVRIELPE